MSSTCIPAYPTASFLWADADDDDFDLETFKANNPEPKLTLEYLGPLTREFTPELEEEDETSSDDAMSTDSQNAATPTVNYNDEKQKNYDTCIFRNIVDPLHSPCYFSYGILEQGAGMSSFFAR